MPKPRSDYKARRSGQLRNRSDHLGFFNMLLNLSARFIYSFFFFHFAPIEKRLPWLGFDPMTSRSAAKHHTHWANTAGLFLCVLAFVSCVFFFFFQFRCNCFAVYSLSDTRFKKASHFFFLLFLYFLPRGSRCIYSPAAPVIMKTSVTSRRLGFLRYGDGLGACYFRR